VATRSSARKIAILGAGNIGGAVARGLVAAGHSRAAEVTLTRRHAAPRDALAAEGFHVSTDNRAAVRAASIVILAVQPGQVLDLVREIRSEVAPKRHLIVSVVSGVRCADLLAQLPEGAEVVRAMPNTAIAIRESMTCLAGDAASRAALERARRIFDTVGKTLVIPEDLMVPATALCACGIAFFLRSVRAARRAGSRSGFTPTTRCS
jgi:pyrroline-5-carboxylate reductase